MREAYPSDITDEQWLIIEPIVNIPNPRGRPRTTDMREVINALSYIGKSGCQWDMIPHEFPPRSTVHYHFLRLCNDGSFEEVNRIVVGESRKQMGRDEEPTAAVIDSQSSQSINICEDVGYDAAKGVKGRKRHIGVDVKGHLLAAKVHAANISERAGAKLLLRILSAWFCFLSVIFADGGYSGPAIAEWVMKECFLKFEIIKRPRKKFQIVKFRWVVERTFAWLLTNRRLSKSYERYSKSEEAWIYFCAGMMTLRRITS